MSTTIGTTPFLLLYQYRTRTIAFNVVQDIGQNNIATAIKINISSIMIMTNCYFFNENWCGFRLWLSSLLLLLMAIGLGSAVNPQDDFQGYMENIEQANKEAKEFDDMMERHRVSLEH